MTSMTFWFDNQPSIQASSVDGSDIPAAGRHLCGHLNPSILQDTKITRHFSDNVLFQAPDIRAFIFPRELSGLIRESIAAACRCMIGPAIQ